MQAQPAVILLCGLHCGQEWLPQISSGGWPVPKLPTTLLHRGRRAGVSARLRNPPGASSHRRCSPPARYTLPSRRNAAAARVIGIGQHLLDERPPAPTGSRSPRLICGRSMRPMSRVRGDVCLICAAKLASSSSVFTTVTAPGLQQLEDLRVVAPHEQAELAGRAGREGRRHRRGRGRRRRRRRGLGRRRRQRRLRNQRRTDAPRIVHLGEEQLILARRG